MLEHSPPFPLVIDHADKNRSLTLEDEEGIKLALRHHNRICRIRLAMITPCPPELVNSIDKEFPILEHLCIDPLTYNDDGLVLPKTFRAPNLCHLVPLNCALPAGSTLLSTTTGLITLSLNSIPPSVSWYPTDLLHRVSSMPQLRTLGISFCFATPNLDVGRRVVNKPNMTHVVLPNLCWRGFQGGSTYIEALLHRITAPLLEKLQIYFLNEFSVSIQNLQRFISSADNLRFTSASLEFGKMGFSLQACPHEGSRKYALSMEAYSLQSRPQLAVIYHRGDTRRSRTNILCGGASRSRR